MLRIYPVMLDLVRCLVPLTRELERHDPDLARQLKRALSSGPLKPGRRFLLEGEK